jgi:hypothetical protein
VVLAKAASIVTSTRIVAGAYMNQQVYKPMEPIPAHERTISEPPILPACPECKPIIIRIRRDSLLGMKECEHIMNPTIE